MCITLLWLSLWGTNVSRGARAGLGLPLRHSWGGNRRLQAFQKKVLKISGSKEDEGQKNRIKLHNEEFYKLKTLRNILLIG